MADYFMGEIMLWPTFRGAPSGWFTCDGSLLSISEYDALYTLLGTTYGGDGQTTFGLPDLRGRVPVHRGTAPGMQSYTQGELGGVEDVTLTTAQMAQHSHAMLAAGVPGDTSSPGSGAALATMGPATSSIGATYAAPGGTQVALANSSVGIAGSGQPHNNIQPSVAISYIICALGIYPAQP